jgi:hypothetical protein
MLDFVQKWLFVYGTPKCPDTKQSLLARWKEEFFRAFGFLLKSNDQAYSAVSTSEHAASTYGCMRNNRICNRSHCVSHTQETQPPPPAAALSKAAAATAPAAAKAADVSVPIDPHHKAHGNPTPIFEILRIRNRLHPALLDVPGGYRDFALKVKIGFFR